MSDGISDALALGDLEGDVRDAAQNLAKALRRCEVGHRGLTINGLRVVNEVLDVEGFVLVRKPK